MKFIDYNQKKAIYEDKIIIAKNIKKLRSIYGISQAELAERIGLGRGMISCFENSVHIPTVVHLIDLCNIFRVTMESLLFVDFDVEIQIKLKEK